MTDFYADVEQVGDFEWYIQVREVPGTNDDPKFSAFDAIMPEEAKNMPSAIVHASRYVYGTKASARAKAKRLVDRVKTLDDQGRKYGRFEVR